MADLILTTTTMAKRPKRYLALLLALLITSSVVYTPAMAVSAKSVMGRVDASVAPDAPEESAKDASGPENDSIKADGTEENASTNEVTASPKDSPAPTIISTLTDGLKGAIKAIAGSSHEPENTTTAEAQAAMEQADELAKLGMENRLIIDGANIPVDGSSVQSGDTTIAVFDTAEAVEEAKTAMNADTRIGIVETDSVVAIQSDTPVADESPVTDESANKDAAGQKIEGNVDATNANTENDGLTVAVIDTGVNGVENIDLTGEGTADENGHGTRMAQLILSKSDNKAKILSIKAIGKDGTGKLSNIIVAVNMAIDNKADIINMSFSMRDNNNTDTARQVIQKALDAGIKVVVAAGNQNSNAASYFPGNISGVITVGAVDDQGAVREVSNKGDCINYFGYANYTSEAAAMVSGVLAGHGDLDNTENIWRADKVTGNEVPDTKELPYGLTERDVQTIEKIQALIKEAGNDDQRLYDSLVALYKSDNTNSVIENGVAVLLSSSETLKDKNEEFYELWTSFHPDSNDGIYMMMTIMYAGKYTSMTDYLDDLLHPVLEESYVEVADPESTAKNYSLRNNVTAGNLPTQLPAEYCFEIAPNDNSYISFWGISDSDLYCWDWYDPGSSDPQVSATKVYVQPSNAYNPSLSGAVLRNTSAGTQARVAGTLVAGYPLPGSGGYYPIFQAPEGKNGQVGCWVYNVGKYRGEQVDVKITYYYSKAGLIMGTAISNTTQPRCLTLNFFEPTGYNADVDVYIGGSLARTKLGNTGIKFTMGDIDNLQTFGLEAVNNGSIAAWAANPEVDSHLLSSVSIAGNHSVPSGNQAWVYGGDYASANNMRNSSIQLGLKNADGLRVFIRPSNKYWANQWALLGGNMSAPEPVAIGVNKVVLTDENFNAGNTNEYQYKETAGIDYTKFQFAIRKQGNSTRLAVESPDSMGWLYFTGLYEGETYVIEEISSNGLTNRGGRIDYKDNNLSQAVTVTPDNDSSSGWWYVNWYNTKAPNGSVTVSKSVFYDYDYNNNRVSNGYKASGVDYTKFRFAIYQQGSGTALQTKYCDANGNVTFTGLSRDKSYTIRELNANGLTNKGGDLNTVGHSTSSTSTSVNITPDDATTNGSKYVRWYNVIPTTSVSLRKSVYSAPDYTSNALTNRLTEEVNYRNFEFCLYEKGSNTVLQRKNPDANGNLTFTNLVIGKAYVIRETNANGITNRGGELSTTRHTTSSASTNFEFTAAADQRINWYNTIPVVDLALKKHVYYEADYVKNTLANRITSGVDYTKFQFSIYKSGSNRALQTKNPDRNGDLTFNNLLVGQTYEIRETNANALTNKGGELSSTTHTTSSTSTSLRVTASSDLASKRINWYNTIPKVDVKLVKNVYTESDYVNNRMRNRVTAPYVDYTKFQFSVYEKGSSTPVYTQRPNSNGELVFDDLKIGQTYVVKETDAIDLVNKGGELSSTSHTPGSVATSFEFTPSVAFDTDVWIEWYNTLQPYEGQITTQKFAHYTTNSENSHIWQSDTIADKPEVGATFRVWLQSSGSYNAAPNNRRAMITIGADGVGTTDKTLPYGTYCVQQYTGWPGTTLDNTVYTVTIPEVYITTASRYNTKTVGGKPVVDMFVTDIAGGSNARGNMKRLVNTFWSGQFTITKRDAYDNGLLNGFEFTLKEYDYTGRNTNTIVLKTGDKNSDGSQASDGTVTFYGLRYGYRYTWQETLAAQGYLLDESNRGWLGGDNNFSTNSGTFWSANEATIMNTDDTYNVIRNGNWMKSDGAARASDTHVPTSTAATLSQETVVGANGVTDTLRVNVIGTSAASTVYDRRRPAEIPVTKVDENGNPVPNVTFCLQYSIDNGTTWNFITKRATGDDVSIGTTTADVENYGLVGGCLTTDANGYINFTGLRANSPADTPSGQADVIYKLTEVGTSNGKYLLKQSIVVGALPLQYEAEKISGASEIGTAGTLSSYSAQKDSAYGNMTQAAKEFEWIDANGDGRIDTEERWFYTLPYEVTNGQMFQLPLTGGEGFPLLPIGVAMALGGATAVIVTTKKKKSMARADTNPFDA